MKEENQTIIKAINMFGRVPEQYELLEEIERLNNIINEINSIVEYWGYDKEHNDISSFRMAMKNIKDILGSDKKVIEENKRFDDEHLCKTYELLNTPKFRNYVYDFDGKGNYCEYIDEYEVKIDELQDQLQQKENIIKEVREYIDKQDNMNYKFREDLREITSKGE